MAQPLLLVYHLPAQKLTRLRIIAIRLNVRIHPVEKASYLQPIGALCGVSEPFDALYDGEDFPEEMLVMRPPSSGGIGRRLNSPNSSETAAKTGKRILAAGNDSRFAAGPASAQMNSARQPRKPVRICASPKPSRMPSTRTPHSRSAARWASS